MNSTRAFTAHPIVFGRSGEPPENGQAFGAFKRAHGSSAKTKQSGQWTVADPCADLEQHFSFKDSAAIQEIPQIDGLLEQVAAGGPHQQIRNYIV